MEETFAKKYWMLPSAIAMHSVWKDSSSLALIRACLLFRSFWALSKILLCTLSYRSQGVFKTRWFKPLLDYSVSFHPPTHQTANFAFSQGIRYYPVQYAGHPESISLRHDYRTTKTLWYNIHSVVKMSMTLKSLAFLTWLKERYQSSENSSKSDVIPAVLHNCITGY